MSVSGLCACVGADLGRRPLGREQAVGGWLPVHRSECSCADSCVCVSAPLLACHQLRVLVCSCHQDLRMGGTHLLTEPQLIGLQYYEEFQIKIPRYSFALASLLVSVCFVEIAELVSRFLLPHFWRIPRPCICVRVFSDSQN